MLTVTLVIEYQLPLIKIGKVFFNLSDGKDLLVAIYRRERAPVWCLVDDDSLSRYLVFIMRRGSVLTTYCTPNPLLWLIWTKVSAHIIFFCAFFSYLSFDRTDAMVNLKSQYNQSSTLETYAISWGWLQRPIEQINDSLRVPLLCYSIFLLRLTNRKWHVLKTGCLKNGLILVRPWRYMEVKEYLINK